MTNEAGAPGQGSPLGSGRDEATTSAAVRGMFASVAHRYDFLNHFLSIGRDIAWRRATARALRDILSHPGSRVADLCCGTGDLSFSLSRYSRGTVMGADFCHPMLAIARGKAGRQGRRVHFLEADALHLPFGDAALDAVTSAFGFRNLANYDQGIAEMRRVLKPGGRACHPGIFARALAGFRPAFSLLFSPRPAAHRCVDFRGRWPLPLSARFGGQVPGAGCPGGKVARRGLPQSELCEFYGGRGRPARWRENVRDSVFSSQSSVVSYSYSVLLQSSGAPLSLNSFSRSSRTFCAASVDSLSIFTSDCLSWTFTVRSVWAMGSNSRTC